MRARCAGADGRRPAAVVRHDHVLADGGPAAAGRINGPAPDRHAGCAVVHRHQYRRRLAVSRRRARAAAGGAQQRRIGRQFLADADSAVHPDGRGAVPHRPRPQGDRRGGRADPPRAGSPGGGGGRGGHRVLRHLGVDHRHHGHARLADAAGHAGAWLSSDHGGGAHHGHRGRRHADPAIGADRAARQPVRHLDLQAPDRRHSSRPDALGCLRLLHRRACTADAIPCAAGPNRAAPCRGERQAAARLRGSAGWNFRRRGRRHVRRAGDAHGIGRARRLRDHRHGDRLSLDDADGASKSRWKGRSPSRA